jgi:hypothetical protein
MVGLIKEQLSGAADVIIIDEKFSGCVPREFSTRLKISQYLIFARHPDIKLHTHAEKRVEMRFCKQNIPDNKYRECRVVRKQIPLLIHPP